MKKTLYLLSAICMICSCTKSITISQEELMDKIKGGWAGQAIGCTYGGPTEFHFHGSYMNDSVVLDWPDGAMKWYYDNAPGLYDDIYMDLTFVSAFDKFGLDAPVDSIAKAYADAPYPLWHANQQGRYNIHHGISPRESGYWMNNPHADDIDFQIEADYAGLMAPGLMCSAAHYCDEIGHIMNYGDGWYGGVYVAAMYSLAFVENDIEKVVTDALEMIPAQSTYYQCIADIIKWHAEYPEDWHKTWDLCQEKWGFEKGCPCGVFSDFNIDAKLNSAYIVIGLLYGEKDYGKTLEIATRCGQDSDCNPASAGGILGTMLGYSNIPDYWKKNLPEVEDRPFSYTDISLNSVYQMSYNQALAVIEKAGGKVKGDVVTIPVQKAKAVRLEQAYEGMKPLSREMDGRMLSDTTTTVTFDGTGIVIMYGYKDDENYTAMVEISLDGGEPIVVDLPFGFHDRQEDMYHVYGLTQGPHTVAIKWLNPQEERYIRLSNILIYEQE